MANVIREDVIKVSYETSDALKSLSKLQDEVNALKKKLTGDMGGDGLEELRENANKAVKPLQKVKENAEKVVKKVTEIGKKAATTAFNGLKKLAGISFKALTAGIGAAAAAITGLVSKSVSAYADFEQLKGGVETLFGAKGATSIEEYAKTVGKSVKSVTKEYENKLLAEKTVMTNANNAFKTAGLSANEYMDTVTSFSASLITSLGNDTNKAADLSHLAIVDMSDNANKMGTDMSLIQNAYQGFAKQNYTMLDNLKLGYGGTKTEMERLVKDAAKIDKSVNANSLSFDNIVKAIHAVQDSMYITGTTQKEAEHTISGSLNMVKSAWGNLMPALIQGGDTFDQCIENLVYSVDKFADNAMPAVEKALAGVGTLIEKLVPKFTKKFPEYAEKLLPPLIKAAIELTKGLIAALPSIIKTVAVTIVDIFGEQFPIISKIGDFFENNTGRIANAIKTIVPAVVALAGAFKLLKGVKSITSILGGLKKGGSSNGGIFSIFEGLAKTKTTTVLKGMANLAIILGGFIILAAALAAVSPHIAKLTDITSFVKVVSVIAVLGVLGTVLAQLGQICGKIPVTTVLKGLANMAIVLAGFTVLAAAFMLVSPYIAKLANTQQILKVVGVMVVLGILGTALSAFAGIAGMIPIPVVLAGLANMALVITGMTAIIVAFGALSKIEGFNDFIESGGELLSKVFGVIGKITGSLVGGIGEGVTNSLPKIGENIAKFAQSIKPLFSVFEGVDMAGVGTFFNAFGSFMLKMTGNKILSFFTGGTNLGKLGTELTLFAAKSVGFFTIVSTFPELGFTNAKKLFDCFAGMKSLPKEGGVVSWFTGKINYDGLAKGLAKLSGEKVLGFFNAVSTIEQAGFDNAKALFDCLAGLKSLPKNGGVVAWFCGDISYSNIAKGLKSLSGEGVKNFFTMTGSLNETAFTNTTKLFDCLAKIKKLPKEGGWWDKLTGEETTTISNIATELSNFGTKTKDFFAQINTLDISKLNGLWDSLNKSKDVTANVSKIVDKNISDIVKKISDLPVKMGEGLKKSGKSLADALVAVWKNAVKASAAPVNKVLEAANWILKEFGSEQRVATWQPYAKGTDGHKGGNALVNDGRGAEMVQMPNGSIFIPKGKNVLIPNAPKGMKVLPAEQTAQFMGKKSPTFSYANGTGNIDLWSYIDNAKGLVGRISSGVNYSGLSGLSSNISRGMVSTITGEMTAWVEKLFDEAGALSIADYVASKGVSQWRTTVIRALKMEGLYNAENVKRTLYQMQTESGGNPKAINLWDSNAKKGTPSKGLMQVIDPTFKAYARAGYNKNIYDPLSNILASVRYATARYGSLAKAYRGVGYANGGIATEPSIFGENGAEMAIPLSRDKRSRGINLWAQTGEILGLSSYTPESSTSTCVNSNTTEYNNYSPQFNLTISGTSDDRTTARKVKRWIQEALDEAFDSFERKDPTLREA